MTARFSTGTRVQTPFGKGVVRELRNGGRLLVEVQGRSLVLRESDVLPLDEGQRRAPAPPRAPQPRPPVPGGTAAEIDLHGLTVEEALARAQTALNDALLGDSPELRLIHGRSGGRIRAALHAWLRSVPAVRGFATDPANPGVTIVRL